MSPRFPSSTRLSNGSKLTALTLAGLITVFSWSSADAQEQLDADTEELVSLFEELGQIAMENKLDCDQMPKAVEAWWSENGARMENLNISVRSRHPDGLPDAFAERSHKAVENLVEGVSKCPDSRGVDRVMYNLMSMGNEPQDPSGSAPSPKQQAPATPEELELARLFGELSDLTIKHEGNCPEMATALYGFLDEHGERYTELRKTLTEPPAELQKQVEEDAIQMLKGLQSCYGDEDVEAAIKRIPL